MKLTDLSIEIKKAEDGEWFPHPYFEGVDVCIRSNESDHYVSFITGEVEKIPRGLKGKELEEAQQKVVDRATAQLVAGWRGIDDAEYTPDTAERWATTREVKKGFRLDPAFFLGVRELSDKSGRRDKAALKASAKNSRKGSRTGSRTRRSTPANGSS
jgi:hypothetical protein